MNREALYTYLRKHHKELGVSLPTIQTYHEQNKYSAEVCLKANQISNGLITGGKLRPDLFTVSGNWRRLGEKIIDNFERAYQNSDLVLLTSILRFIESERPELFEDLLIMIEPLDGGVEFVKQYEVFNNDD